LDRKLKIIDKRKKTYTSGGTVFIIGITGLLKYLCLSAP
jgi:hypothetical protein